MKFSFFESVKTAHGRECTYETFLDATQSERVRYLCAQIARETDADKRGELKKQLPIVTWQAYFPGARKNSEAEPSGLFMLDVDHVERPFELWSRIVPRKGELGIVFAGMTASQKGLRLVARCRPEFSSIEECQRWLAGEIGTDYDAVCKDWARSSFLVHDSYTYYMDGRLFTDEPTVVYPVVGGAAKPNIAMEEAAFNGDFSFDAESGEEETQAGDEDTAKEKGGDRYKGILLQDIAREWLLSTGGEPERGERNTRLYKLALRMRHICDFDEALMNRVMPRYGLTKQEVAQVVHSAVVSNRGAEMQEDLKEVIQRLQRATRLGGEDDDLPPVITSTNKVPDLPPLLKQWWDVSPEDFKVPVTLCQLPILGTLASRLRARYLDGQLHSPSFQVSLEAPQASGKSFMGRLVDYELAAVKRHDEEERQREEDYNARIKEMKMLNVKITPENKQEILGTKPQTLIRYLPATVSITKLLMRMQAAQGLHVFAMAPEIDTVHKSFKRSFSSLSDLLRVAFDNGEFGQDYASAESFSGNVRMYYNTLYSGTPKAMRRFYPDLEDGLVSRVLFVVLPDQFGKAMPVWREFTKAEKQVVDVQLVRLDEVSLVGNEVQQEHIMKMDWLNKRMKEWILAQQAEAVRADDRTRDIFCRRAAVVGFRAGILAWFLWGEVQTPTIRRKVCDFAMWIANHMLNQHLLRFQVTEESSNVNRWADIYKELGDEFTREEVESKLRSHGIDTPVKMVLYKWKLLGNIEETEVQRRGAYNKKQAVKFKKTAR